jgi:hypothetical protein
MKNRTLTPLAVLTAALGLLAASLVFASASALAEPLPDSRAYEMVTPAENYDADVYVPEDIPADQVVSEGEFPTRLPFEVAEDGEAVAYGAAPTVEGTGNGGLGVGDEYLARRLPGGGWARPVNLQPLGENGAVINTGFYQAFSPDLAVGILQSGNSKKPEALLSPQAPGEGYAVLYTRALEGKSYQPFFTSAPTNRSPEAFETANLPEISPLVPHQVDFAGASAGFDRLLFEANGVFAGTGAVEGEPGENNLYESVGGRLSLVNVLPDGQSEANATFGASPLSKAAKPPPNFGNVISGDGARVFWSDLNVGKEALYVSEGVGSPGERTVQVDASQTPGGKGGGGRYWTASKDGSRVFFGDSDANDLTGDTQAGSGENLYVYEVPTGKLVDLTPAAHAELEGVLGEGETTEGKYTIYFVAKGVLEENPQPNSNGAVAEEGVDNLYMLEEGKKPTFIAVLTGRDGIEAIEPLANVIGEVGDWTPGVGHRTAEVTPDGGSLVFMSNNQKFDGHYEEAYGQHLEEVYVYDAATGMLSCASCTRDGLKAQENIESERDLGAFLPVSDALTYQPTVISGDGSRVFFDSGEPLVSGDTNGEQDVYEWEQDGSGGCGVSGGCVYLLSSGSGSTSSFLIGADATGDNAFFVTRAQLAPQDGNENYDLYDARVDGVQQVLPPACSGTGCQGVPGQAPTFATPSSVTFEGVGNYPPPSETTASAKSKAKTRPLTNAQKLTKALAVCHKQPKGKRRASCEARTRRRYQAKSRRK